MQLIGNATFFSKLEIKAILAFTSNDITRPHLSNVLIGPGLAVATDGHRLIKCELPTAEVATSAAVVSAAALEQAAKIVPKGGSVRVVVAGRSATVAVVADATEDAAPIVSFNALIDAVFPPFGQVIPGRPAKDADVARSVGVNASYLADIAPVCKAAGVTGMTIHAPSDALSPIRCDIGTDWIVVTMPMRI